MTTGTKNRFNRWYEIGNHHLWRWRMSPSLAWLASWWSHGMLRFNTAIHHATTFHYICSFPRNVVASQCIIIRFVLCREQNQNQNYSSLDLSWHISFQLHRSGQAKGLNNDNTIESICRNQIHFCMQMQKLRSSMEEEVDRNQKKR